MRDEPGMNTGRFGYIPGEMTNVAESPPMPGPAHKAGPAVTFVFCGILRYGVV